jgi:hypothetical protein
MREVVAAIDRLASVRAPNDLARLQELAERYFALPEAPEHLGVWFRLYERFPEDDAFGVFWTVLHGVEAQPNFEQLVIESVRRRPSGFPVRMVNGLLNAGIRQVGGVQLLELLQEVAGDDRSPPGLREEAVGFLEYQRSQS